MSRSRLLTQGEIHLARQIFKHSVDYGKVKVHDHKYASFQFSTVVMTPNGEIYAPQARYSNDYSAGTREQKALLIHEMVHVWQYQNNILNVKFSSAKELVRNLFNYDKAYNYTLSRDKDLLDYGLEQQAAMIEDYYRVFRLGDDFRKTPDGSYRSQNEPAERKELLKIVTARFVSDPKYTGGR